MAKVLPLQMWLDPNWYRGPGGFSSRLTDDLFHPYPRMRYNPALCICE